MSSTQESVEALVAKGYEQGFVTKIETDIAPPGLSEDTIRFISAKKNEPDWVLERDVMSTFECSEVVEECFDRFERQATGRPG